ncbi:MAG: galactokinase [Bacilli bacterium]|nr:galactokinase [Bacilli bacterium]
MRQVSSRKEMMDLTQEFYNAFKVAPESLYRAPARINLIGEHIDYNGGRVLPAAISCYIKALVSKRDDTIISAYSTNTKSGYSIDLNRIKYDKANGWCNYVFGVFQTLRLAGYHIPFGLNILINSEIPLGSGLSSSAALLDLVTYVANDIYNLGISLKNIAKLAQNCENSFCGLRCGIMDEASIALGLRDKCLLLDCAKYEYEYIDLDLGDYTFVVMKTNVPRSLVSSKYNDRVDECQKGLRAIQQDFNVDNLCELHEEDLLRVEKLIGDELIYRRVRHVITENERVRKFVRALRSKNIEELGRILNASHKSLKEDYEVTGEYLDAIQEAAIYAGAIGARMTGAGFGGCAIALIKKSSFEEFKEKVIDYYFKKVQLEPDVFNVDIVDGPMKVEDY